MAEWFPMFRTGGMAAAEKELNAKYKAKYGTDAPVANAADRPDDKLPKQAVLEESMRKNGGVGWGEGFMTGFQRPISVLNAGYDRAIMGVDEEKLRKYSQSVHNLAPVADTLGMLAGAGVGAVTSGVGMAKSMLGSGGKAAVTGIIGEGATPVVLKSAGPSVAERGLTYLTSTGGKALAARPLGVGSGMVTAGIGGALGANALGVGDKFLQQSEQLAQQSEQDRINAWFDAHPNQKAGRAAMSSGTSPSEAEYQSRSATEFRKIYTPDGQLRSGVTPEQELATRAWAAHEAKGLAGQTPERLRDTTIFDPAAFMGNLDPAVVRAAGGRGVNGMVAVANAAPTLAAAVEAGPDSQGAPAPMPAGVASAAPPGWLADVMDQYEAAHPGNEGGPLTAEQYKQYRREAQYDARSAAEQQRQQLWVGLGQQIGITDPQAAIAFGQEGGFTQALMDASLTAQQGRSTQRMGYKDLQWQIDAAALQVAQAKVDKMPDGPEKEQQQAIVNVETKRLQGLVYQPTMPPALQDLGVAGPSPTGQ